MNQKEEFLKALSDNDPEQIAALQKAGFQPDYDALNYVAEKGYTEIARLLLQHKDIRCRNFCAFPLRIAVQNGHMDLVKLFLFEKEGPFYQNLDIGFNDGKPVRHIFLWAIEEAYINVVRLFIDRDSDRYGRENSNIYQQGYNLAIKLEQLDIVALLLDDDRVSPNLRKGNCSPLVMAVETGNPALVNLLLEDDRIDASANNNAALSKVCELGNQEIFNLLVAYGVLSEGIKNFNPSILPIEKNPEKPVYAALEYAIKNKHKNIVLHFLKQPDMDLKYIFAWSVQFNFVDIIPYVLKQEPALNPQFYKSYCLRLAAGLGHHEIVNYLLQDGRAKPEALEDQALRVAVEKGHTKVVTLLLADPRVNPAAREHSALRMAARNGHSEIVKLLLADPRADFHIKDPENYSDLAYIPSSVLKVFIDDKRLNLDALPDINYSALKYQHNSSDYHRLMNLYTWLPWSLEKLVVNIADKTEITETDKNKLKASKLLNTCGLFQYAQPGLVKDVNKSIGNFMLQVVEKALDKKKEPGIEEPHSTQNVLRQ